jgi:SAM-dependent methyltransferase
VSRADEQYGTPSTADVVRDFYERHPYPPPLTDLSGYRQRWNDPQLRRCDFHLHWPWRAFSDAYSILVAGCGTSQAAKHAIRWPEAQVVAIDVSSTSVRCTEELKSRYGLTNLTVQQLPVEQVAELRCQFDQIVCTGVLHHLPDPAAGLGALRNVLKPDGVLHLMVYAPYGRSGIYMIQEFCRRTGIMPTDPGLQQLLATLRLLPADHPVARTLRDAPDFRSAAGLADALLNPQDRAYSVPELFSLLEGNGLQFVRWVRQAPYSARCGLLMSLPGAAQLQDLPPREESAAAELFRGTMVRHSALVYRNDHPWQSRRVGFTGQEFLESVPLRLPDTVTVRERVPRGAVAVLGSRSHAYADTTLPVGARELRLVESIDGTRTVAELIADGADPDRTTALLERLWWHDQIVFDASRSS